MHLQEIIQQAVLHFGTQQFGGGRFFGGEFAFHVARDAVIQIDPKHSNLSLGLGKLEAMHLEIENLLPEDLALLGIGDGLVQHGFHTGATTGGDNQTFLRQLMHQLAKAGIFLAQKMADRHAHILKEKLTGVLRMQADFLKVTALGEARRAFFHANQ